MLTEATAVYRAFLQGIAHFQMSLCVIKYGSSVLRSVSDVSDVAANIALHTADRKKVVAVVSAFEGRTAELIAAAKRQLIEEDSIAYTKIVGAGEYESAESLIREFRKRDISAALVIARQMGFIAVGSRVDAEPMFLDRTALRDAIESSPIVIIPGFSAIDHNGEPVLLGRGGSDIAAVHLAAGLGLSVVRLIKDVDAVYDADPNEHEDARRLFRIDYKTALAVGGKLIQPKALRYAEETGITIEIAALGQPPGTLIDRHGAQR